jgi:urease accessory protein
MWLLPVIFPVVMAFGGALGVLGVPMPGVETGIALSAVALGFMVAFAAKPPLWIAAVLVGVFAIFHGHAHGTELPKSANAMTYAVGFVMATGLLHLSGIALGLLVNWPWGRVIVRASGGAIAMLGFGFLFGFIRA